MPSQKSNQSESPVRITRRCLIGTGIVSGLELALDDTHQICITPGKGLTSDGKYTEVYTTMLFSFYRDYMPDAPYDFFKKKNGEVIPLWELVNEDDFTEGDQPLSPQYDQESRNPFLKDKVVLLFLDVKQKPAPDPDGSSEENTEENTDENDQQENENIDSYRQRFLLMRRDDLLQQLNIQRLATHIVWQRLEDDEDYIAGKKWAREQELNIPVPSKQTHDEYVQVYRRIHRESKKRYPGDVVAQNRFREGAKSWAGA